MPIVLLYHSKAVGPVCRIVAEQQPDKIKIACDKDQSGISEDDLVIRWDSVRPTKALECQLARIVKTSRNKTESRRVLGLLAPPTYFRPRDIPDDSYPVIVRPKRHHAGHSFVIADDYPMAHEVWPLGGYASPIINKDTEFRVYVFQSHVISVSKRICDDPTQIAWNVALGSRMIKLKRKSWPIDVVRTSLRAAKALNLNWGAIDVAKAVDGQVVVFEANTAPGLVPTARSLPLIAKAFAWSGDHVDFNEEPDLNTGTSWKHFLHPALRKG